MKIHSNDWEMTLNNAHDPSAEYILIPIIHYEIALLRSRLCIRNFQIGMHMHNLAILTLLLLLKIIVLFV